MNFLARSPFSDVIFVFEGIDWLRWLVGFFFFSLGLFAGWWKWRYRRQIKSVTDADTRVALKLSPSVPDPEDETEPPHGTSDSDFGGIYETAPHDLDDLQRIHGIGKALRAKLYSLGIYKFNQIASWNEAQVAAVSKKLQLVEEIGQDEWIEQAQGFLDGKLEKN